MFLLPVLCCAVLCCAVLCCAVLCCAVLCCAVLCCAVLCCAVLLLVNTIYNVSNSTIAVCSVSHMGHPMDCYNTSAACYVDTFACGNIKENQYLFHLHGIYLVPCIASVIICVVGMQAAVA